MIARALFVAALCGWFASPVSATLHFFRRGVYCVDTVTTTITLTASNSQVAAVLSTVNDDGEQYYEPPLQTTALSSTALPTSQYPTSSTSPHTVTLTATQLVVQTKTVLESQTLTQTQYLVQTVYTSSLTGLQQSDSTTVLTETQTRTLTSTLYNDINPFATVSSVPGASLNSLTNTTISLPSTHRPSYPNGTVTVPFSNYSAPTTIDNAPSTPTSILSLLQASPTLLVSSLTSSLAQVAPSLETPVPTSSLSNSITGFENTLYFANWAIYGAQYQPQSLPAAFVSRINYAFADIDSNGNVISSDTYADLQKHYSTDSWDEAGNNAYGCVKQLYILKKQNRHMKVLLSVGGWTWSSKFSPMAADPTMRENFVSSAVQLVTDWGFDGIDIDWEFNAYTPTSQDSQNIIFLLQALRTAFDAWSAAHASGYHFLITVASPAGAPVYGLWDLAAMDPYVDAWNLMAYDYTGSWSTASGHSSNIYFDSQDMPATPYSTDQAVSAYVAGGVPSSKIILGLPLYGRSFEQTAGLGQPFDGVGTGDDLGTGQWRVKNLPKAGATEFYDDTARASYSYDATTQELISYDNEQSISEKSAYLKAKDLGGAMFWEASDDRNGTQSLVVAMAGQLGTLDVAMNLLDYPTSQYDNIRNGMPGS